MPIWTSHQFTLVGDTWNQYVRALRTPASRAALW
jgi:hypothetical protein